VRSRLSLLFALLVYTGCSLSGLARAEPAKLPSSEPRAATAGVSASLLAGRADAPLTVPFPAPTLVIIIDDLGHQLDSGLRAASLPGKVTLAILPHTPNGALLAHRASAAGKEVMLHAPMSNLNRLPLGPGALTTAMSEQDFRSALSAAIASTPHIRGVNNHMGSELTALRRPMEWLMQELHGRQLYFVDSRTTGLSVGASVAREYGIPALSRQVFLDNDTSPAAIAEQFRELTRRARSDGIAVAIGHPHPQTLAFLETALPRMTKLGYRLALVSEVVDRQNATIAVVDGSLSEINSPGKDHGQSPARPGISPVL
jgi:polysaccharide deacetylase 2 family uncharacterized protein YibQ